MQYLTLLVFHYFLLRLYSVLHAEDASALPDAATPKSKSNVVPLAVGLTLGILALATAAFYVHRRWRRQRTPVGVPSEETLKP